MIVWLDAQLPPALAIWMRSFAGIEAHPLLDLGLRDAGDKDIFERARFVGLVIISKDIDFVHLCERHGPPPQIVHLLCGNVENALFERRWLEVCRLLEAGEPIAELG